MHFGQGIFFMLLADGQRWRMSKYCW